MNWKIIFAAIVLVVIGFFALRYLLQPNFQVTNYPSAGTDIIAFGDSLVAGVGADKGKSFVDLLSQGIGEPIINLGVPGNTTLDGLARLKDLDHYKPKVILLLLGGNDRLREVPKEEVFKNLATIIENLQARGSIVLLLGVRGGILGDPYAQEYEKLHNTYHTAYVPDVLAGLFGDSRYMADQIHPNNAGHARIAERVYPVLEKLLK
jgi:acyl-CoA thioesterase-1